MPQSNSERCKAYRERRRAARGGPGVYRRRRQVSGQWVEVFAIGSIVSSIVAKYRLPEDKTGAVRATLKRWMDEGAVPASCLGGEGSNAARVYSAEQRDLIVKLYGRHLATPLSLIGVGNWLAARWRKICN